ncbi:MAG: DNA-processing protein DprA, partial [bacterium]
MDQDGRIFLLAFQRLFFHHPIVAKRILDLCGQTSAAFQGDRSRFRECFGESQGLYDLFINMDRWGLFERELAKIDELGARIIGLCDDDYPRMLREIHDPPPVIVSVGSALDALNAPSVAVVGSRLATRHGLDVAAEIAEGLAAAGFTVVSGMAYGIDAAAHRGALSGNGPTVAVLGCGCDIAYPSSNERLAREVERHGLRITEFPLGEPPYQQNFPQRNRIISG